MSNTILEVFLISLIKCAICDDEKEITNEVYNLIQTFAGKKDIPISCVVFNSPDELLLEIKSGKTFDLYFLDIIMPGITGISLAKEIRISSSNAVIIFLTSSDEFTREAYHVEALHYLDKPLDLLAFNHALDRAISYLGNCSSQTALFETKYGTRQISLNQISYVKAYRHVLSVTLSDGTSIDTLSSSLTLAQLTTLLPFPPFSSPCRGYLVNLDHVDYIGMNQFIMKTGDTVPITAKIFFQIKKQYSNYLLTTYKNSAY